MRHWELHIVMDVVTSFDRPQSAMALVYILVFAVVVVAANEPSEGPGQLTSSVYNELLLTCPPDQDRYTSYQFTIPIDCEGQTTDTSLTDKPLTLSLSCAIGSCTL